MPFRLGIAGLCTSHPENWVPIIRELDSDIEITAVWDSGETRPAGFAGAFARRFGIPNAVDLLESMLPLVDGAIIHTANWDRHIVQAEPFVLAGKAVFIDKPIVGNPRDAEKVLAWIRQGHRVTGGSALRCCDEIAALLAIPEAERGAIRTVYASIGKDGFNYGIHGYSLLCGVLGDGLQSARCIACGDQKQIITEWSGGRAGILTICPGNWLPFNATVTTDKQIIQLAIDAGKLYRPLLERALPYLSGKSSTPPFPAAQLLAPEMAAMAALASQYARGTGVPIGAIPQELPGYDGFSFARGYRRGRDG